MATPIRILAIALVIQLVLVAGVYWPGGASSRAGTDKPVLSVDSDKVDQLSIKSGESNKVAIKRHDGGWALPGLSELPADSNQVGSLMTQLNNRRAGLAVATSSEARERFKVGQESFKRRLELALADGSTKVLYFGKSPGANEAYLRRKGEDAIHRVGIGTHLLPGKDENWLDKALLSYKPKEIGSIEVAGLTISRAAKPAPDTEKADKAETPDWQVSGLKDGKVADMAAVKRLVSQLGGFRVSGIAPKSQAPEGEPAFEITVTPKTGSPVTYSLYSAGKDKKARLVSSGHDAVFTVASRTQQTLQKVGSRDKLTRSPEPENKESEKTSDAEAPSKDSA